MNAIVSVGGEHMVSMNDTQLAELNRLLNGTPTVDRYNGDKIQENRRIKLEVSMVVKTRTYETIPEASPAVC